MEHDLSLEILLALPYGYHSVTEHISSEPQVFVGKSNSISSFQTTQTYIASIQVFSESVIRNKRIGGFIWKQPFKKIGARGDLEMCCSSLVPQVAIGEKAHKNTLSIRKNVLKLKVINK